MSILTAKILDESVDRNVRIEAAKSRFLDANESEIKDTSLLTIRDLKKRTIGKGEESICSDTWNRSLKEK